MIAAPVLPHVSQSAALELICGAWLLAGSFYWLGTVAIRRRYGSVAPAATDANRMMQHPVIRGLWIVFLACQTVLLLHRYKTVSYISSAALVLVVTLWTILDRTNLSERRVAYAAGAVVFFTFGALILSTGDKAALFSLGGVLWFSLSLYDLLLLRRAFAEVLA